MTVWHNSFPYIMSNIVTLANSESPLQRLLVKTSEFSPWQYSLKSSVGNHARTQVLVAGSSTPSFGRSYDFEIPRYGLCAGATVVMKVRVKPDATTDLLTSRFIGAALIKSASLQNHNKNLESFGYQHLIGQCVHATSHAEYKRLSTTLVEDPATTDFNRAAAANVATVTDGTNEREIELNVSLPFSCFGSTSNYFDCRFCEQLSINIQLPSSDTEVMNKAGCLSIKQCDIRFDFIQMADDVYQNFVKAQYSLSAPLSVLGSSIYHENTQKYTVAATETVANNHVMRLELKAPGVITHTWFRLIDLGTKTWQLGEGLGRQPEGVVSATTGAIAASAAPGWNSVAIRASGVELVNMSVGQASDMGFGAGGMDRVSKGVIKT
jgi:hypothetical protein